MLRGAAGTLAYMAPEVARREAYDCRCDVWSLGICTYVMLAGHPVYSPDDHDELLRKVRSGAIRYYPATWDRVEPRARLLVARFVVEPVEEAVALGAAAGEQPLTEGLTLVRVDHEPPEHCLPKHHLLETRDDRTELVGRAERG